MRLLLLPAAVIAWTPPRGLLGRAPALHRPEPSAQPLLRALGEEERTILDEGERTMLEEEEERTMLGLPTTTVAAPLSLLLVAQLLLFIGVGAVIPTLPLYGKALGLSSATNGIVIGTPAAALLLLARPAGEFADRARKPAMIAGMALIAVSDLGTACATSLGPLVLARLGLGAGRCVSESGERGMLADFAGRAPELRGRSLAAQQAVAALGIAIGAPAGGLVVERYGPSSAFLCVSAAACVTLCLYTLLPETVAAAEAGDAAPRRAAPATAAWGALLRDDRWRGLALCEAGARFGFAAKIAAVPVLAAQALPGGAVAAGALLSAAGLSGLVGAPAGGWLTDRLGARRTAAASGGVSAAALLLVPAALSPPPWLPPWLPPGLPPAPDGAAFAALVLLWSTAVAAQGPALTALAQTLAPAGAEATAMALPRASGDAVYVVAPFLLGVVADASATPGTECAVAGGLGMLGAIALAVLGRTGA